MSDYSEHLISMAGGDGDVIDPNNHAFLVALVKKQAATIALAWAEADSFDELASHASYNGTEAEMETWLSAATRIRAALEPTK